MRDLLALLTDEETLNLPTNCVITKAYFDTQGTDETVFHGVEYKGNLYPFVCPIQVVRYGLIYYN